MSQPDGGPAFPQAVPFPGDLRDWFAGMALQGLLAEPANTNANPAQIAAWAYDHADAMLRQRAHDP